MDAIRKVAVIGAGTMGAGIAAQIANGGVPVLLLDMPSEGRLRNGVAAAAIDRLRQAGTSPFMSPAAADLVEPGNIEDDLKSIAGCDWIIEVVTERLDVKQELYRRIDALRRPGTPVSSNTSTIPLHQLVAGLPADFARDFLITHFFNPPRQMRLLEVIVGPHSDSATAAAVSRFGDVVLGKSIVRCKDSPGFIANRLGVYWLQLGVHEAVAAGLTVEEADAVMGRPIGIPKTGVFGLLDLIGLDLVPHINASLAAALPPDDPFQAASREEPIVAAMIAAGETGRKGKGGFYRLDRAEGRKVMQVKDLASGAYRPLRPAALAELAAAAKDLRGFLESDTKGGRYAWAVMGRVLAYAAALVPQAADDITAVDEAMRLGYAWTLGPFEMIDKLGAGWLSERLQASAIAVPPLLACAGNRAFYASADGRRQVLDTDGRYRPLARPDGVLMLDDVKRATKPVLKGPSAALWDVGGGVACFEFTGKGNTIDHDLLVLLRQAIDTVQAGFAALVIYNEGAHFSFGANIGHLLAAAKASAWVEIETLMTSGQTVYAALKYASFPVVAAPSGMALGGGCEILLHVDAVQAHAETYAGLVECGIGLIPSWGGCKEMLLRWRDVPDAAGGPTNVFKMIRTAAVSQSAAQAREMKILRAGDGVTMNRARLLADAKARALALVPGYQPPDRPKPIGLSGAAGQDAMIQTIAAAARDVTAHDRMVAAGLADVLCGASSVEPADEDDLLARERSVFMRLVRTPETLARIEHTLATGQPLRN